MCPVVSAALHRETCPSSDLFIHVVLVLRTVFTIVMVALLLLLLGLLHCGKLRVTAEITDTHVYRSKVVWSSRKDVLKFNHLSLLWPLFMLAIRCQTSLFNLFILAVAVRLSHTQNRLKTTEVLMHGLFLKSQKTVFSVHVVVLCFLLDSTDAADNLSSSDTNHMREYMNRRGRSRGSVETIRSSLKS